MNIFQQRQFDRFERAAQFVDAHSKDFDPKSQTISLNAELKNTLGSVQETPKEKPAAATAPKTSASTKKAALNALRAELDRIAVTAEALKKIDPSFSNTFQLPDKRLKDKLVSAAQQFRKDALPLKDRFTSFEMQDDFLEVLSAKLEAYQATQAPLTTRAKGPKKSVDTSGPFNKAAQLMEVLDVMVKNKYAGNTAQLNAWGEATKLNTPQRRRKNESPVAEAKPARKKRTVKTKA